jgi:lipopolysaccharide transport system ATP-binding protein
VSTPVIRVQGLGKRYRIGGPVERPGHLREALVDMVMAPFRRLEAKSGARAGQEEFWALRDVSFDVEQGEVLGIIGKNGAGKSTALKIISRITPPTTGRIELHGRIGSLLEVGTGFHGDLTGRENVYLNGTILGMRRAEIDRKFDEIIAFAGVEAFVDTPVKRYSSGMYMRLAFAVAAHLETEILLVDEVLAVGDLEFQKKCLGKMDEAAPVRAGHPARARHGGGRRPDGDRRGSVCAARSGPGRGRAVRSPRPPRHGVGPRDRHAPPRRTP